MPALAEAEADEISREQSKPHPERHRPHEGQPVGLDEGLMELVAPVRDGAHRRIDRLRDHPVDRVGEPGDRRSEADHTQPCETDRAVGHEHGALHDHQRAQAEPEQRPREARVLAHGLAVEPKADRIRATCHRRYAACQAARDRSEHKRPVARA